MNTRRRLVFLAFLVPIITVAFVSISHVTSWYSIANPLKWAAYLSIGIEVAALSALAGFSVNLGRLLYPPLILVTAIQFIGNVFYNFQFIDIESELFKDWVDLSSPLLYLMGVEENDMISHKRILSVLEGGFLPAISLFFMHLLMKLQDMKLAEPTETKEDNPKEELILEEIPEEPIVEVTEHVEEEILEPVAAQVEEDIEEPIQEITEEPIEEPEIPETVEPPQEVKEEKIKKLYYSR